MQHYDATAKIQIVFSQFINLKIGPELQERVESRKNNCPVCFLGRDGSKYLKEIVEKNRNIVLTS